MRRSAAGSPAHDFCGVYLVKLPHPAVFAPLQNRVCARERRRLERMHDSAARDRSLAAWLLARVLLCEQLAIANSALHITRNPKGKPVLPDGAMHFNLSHAATAAAVAVASRPVGVDVEAPRPVRLELATRFFSPAERAYVFDGAAESAPQRFLEIWVQKEACIKREGRGVPAPLSALDVLREPEAERLTLLRHKDWLVACSCAVKPQQLQVWSADTLLEKAGALQAASSFDF